MWIIKYTNPLDNRVMIKKFKGKYANENSFSYAKSRYENYYMTVSIFGFETLKGKETGNRFSFNKI